MNRRTPRRRISPRTVRRYRAIKNFVRRALGSSSQPDIKSNSSISVSVLDLRHKIDGIEQQLNTVSKHCQELATLESRLKLNDNSDSEEILNTKKIKAPETEVLNKVSEGRCDIPVNTKSTPKVVSRDDKARTKLTPLNKMLEQNNSYTYKENRKSKPRRRLHPIEENEQTLRRRKINMASRVEDVPLYSSHSFNEPRICSLQLDAGYSNVHRQNDRQNFGCFQTNHRLAKLNNHREQTCGDHKNHRNREFRPALDQDFIADIIRRQYRPVKLFGRRESDFSQFSAPVCRDQEFPIRETLQEGSDLCSCCRDEHKRHKHSRYMCSNDLSDMRSICDTRLYSSKKHKYHTNNKNRANDFYNDSAMYDIIPVKEKSSPKSRRKFMEDNTLMHDNHREVPPSPRSRRPQLNLQAQFYTEDDDDRIPLDKQLRLRKRLLRKSLIQNEANVSNMSSEVFIHNKNFKCMQNLQISNDPKFYNEECIGTMNNQQYPVINLEQGGMNNVTTPNSQTIDVSADKTDKTLSEIKNILQNFLEEIKKESSQNEKLDNLPKSETLQNINEAQQMKCNSFHNNNSSFGHCSLPPFMQSFPNTCCYPMFPVCPINCMQKGFLLPSQSFTCTTCANNSTEQTCGNNEFKNKTNNTEDARSETQKLIKEIHYLISQNPNTLQKKEFRSDKLESANKTDKVTVTSKSIAGSSKTSRHDAKVGTTKLKCLSKSCEAIGSRQSTDARFVTNASYSDTVLEKQSGEEITTESTSESEYSSESMFIDKNKGNKFTKILRSIGILKRNKPNVIDESSSSMNIEKPRQTSTFQSHPKSPFQQHIINYNLHGQEYFHPPPSTPHQQYPYEYCGHPPQHDPRTYFSPTNANNQTKKCQGRNFHGQNVPTYCTSPRHIPPAPTCTSYYDSRYMNVPPQAPVCLKEIEVKSIGTQSIRKISLLQKLTNKMQVPAQSSPNQSFSRNFLNDKNKKNKPEPSLFDWKKIHEKAMQKTTDPLKFSYKTQKKLAEGDNKMRNVMLKKLFYKRNPFSPRNLLVRTLLGKDRSSFGEPPKMYKPRMFL